MSVTYIKLFLDYLDALEPYGDAERGRLFTALMEYARSGEVPQLCGNERFIFPMMRAQVDRDIEAFDAVSEARAAAGRKGGIAKAGKCSKAKQSQAKPSKTGKEKDKEKDKDKEENTPPYPPLAVPDSVLDVFRDWLAYKRERKEDYKPTGLKALETQVRNNVSLYGPAAVNELIRECMANGWRGIIWDRLKERKAKNNGFQTSNPFLEMLEEEMRDNGQS